MKYQKKTLIALIKKVEAKKRLSPHEIEQILGFEKESEDKGLRRYLKQVALPLSLALGFFLSVFPDDFGRFEKTLPSWTNLSPEFLRGVDYLWDIIGDPVGKANVLYHVPNIVLYSFGFFGVKKLFEVLDRRSWVDRMLLAQGQVREQVLSGKTNLNLDKGHSILFVGKGDFIGMQMVLNQKADEAVMVSELKPAFTDIWNFYSVDSLYEDLKEVLERADGESAGEYIFFPVKDDQIFLPSPTAYDLSPHKLDILIQNIRTIEKENKWKTKRIIIVGDKYHKSFVQSEDQKGKLPKSEDVISLQSISEKYEKVTLLDPTDLVIKKVLEIAGGRKVIFRATREGISEYKKRFYSRLNEQKFKISKRGVLTIGYDLFEDQTEQQMLSHKIDDYYPVVLSKSVYDALVRNGYKRAEFIYVPDLVLQELSIQAKQQ